MMIPNGLFRITMLQPAPAGSAGRTEGLPTPLPNPQRNMSMPVISTDHSPSNTTYLGFVLAALILAAALLAGDSGYNPLLLRLEDGAAHASTGVTGATGTVPAAAGTVFGSWDAIVSSNIIPLGALAAGLAAVFGGMRAGSGGLIGGGIIGVLAAILTAALPAIVTESAAGADVGALASRSALLSTFTPMTLVVFAMVRYARRTP